MSNLNQNKPKSLAVLSDQEFPTLVTKKSQVKEENFSTAVQTKIFTEDFPALVQDLSPIKPTETRQDITSLQEKKSKFLNGFPSLVSKAVPLFQIGAKEVWADQKPKKRANLNKSYQIPKIQSFSNATSQKTSTPNKNSQSVQSLNRSFESQRSTSQKDRKSSASSVSEKFIDSQSESEAQNEPSKNWPNFEEQLSKVKKILEFKIPLSFPTVEHYQYEKADGFDYAYHYEKARVHKYFQQTSQGRKWTKWTKLGKLRILVINCDFNIPSGRSGNDESSETDDSDRSSNYKKIIKVYWKTTEEERANQIVNQIRLAIFEGIDFICLEEICQPIIRQKVLKMLEEIKGLGQHQYFFPKNLESHPYMRTTMILSKYPVKFGHLKFEIPEYDNKGQATFYFPLQAFCEFEVMIGKKVIKVGILCCHLRSNGQKKSHIRPHKMRKMQVRCIHDFSKRFDKFFCIGDTNIPSSQKFKNENIWLKKRFVDAFDVGRSAIGGTYMYRTKANVIREQRMDRVWMKKDMKDNTDVQIAFKEVLLECCKNKRFNKKEMFGLDEEKLIYISPSDHEILDINIQFTKSE